MSLKINGSAIKTIRVNGSEISLAKLNGYVIFSKQDDTPSPMGSEWLDYNNPHFDGVRQYDALDVWIYNYEGNISKLNGIYLDLEINKDATFYMKALFYGYEGCPVNYSILLLDSNNNDNIVNRYDYQFDSAGSKVYREISVNLTKGNYKIVIGHEKNFEFGISMSSISLT